MAKNPVLIILLMVAIFLIWGYFGVQEAKSVGVTCDVEITEYFCFKQHTNEVGEIEEFFKDLDR